MSEVTEILQAIEQDGTGPTEKLIPLLYEDLHRLSIARVDGWNYP